MVAVVIGGSIIGWAGPRSFLDCCCIQRGVRNRSVWSSYLVDRELPTSLGVPGVSTRESPSVLVVFAPGADDGTSSGILHGDTIGVGVP